MTARPDLERTVGPPGPGGAAPSADDLWSGLPGSNLYKQRKLTGWREPTEDDVERTPERSERLLDAGLRAELDRFLAERARDFNAVMLGVFHLVLQWYLDDVESLVGSWLLAPSAGDGRGRPASVLRPSYVYAEDDVTVEDLLADIEGQLRSPRAVDPDQLPAWASKRAPVFFFAGLAGGRESVFGPADLLALPCAEGRVVAAPVSSAGGMALAVSIPFTLSRTMDVEELHGRYERALSALVAGGDRPVGEVRRQLGGAAEVPYRQLEEMQRRVIALWAGVLGISVESLAESSSYFEVGGTSLNAFKLVNRVRVEFQRDLSIRDIIENPTVQEFSRLLLKD